MWATYSIWRDGRRSIYSSDVMAVFVVFRTFDIVFRILVLEVESFRHDGMKLKAGGLEG